MPFIVIKSNGLEIDRRVLGGTMVIGRAPDCDVTVRDILLSRRHCRFEECGDCWLLTDLQSKNGTIVNGERITAPLVLMDKDVVRIGRSKLTFSLAEYDLDADLGSSLTEPQRPADPSDSLSGTLSGFTLLMPGETESSGNMPCPQPRPRDPAGLDSAPLQELLSAIASSSWDSIYNEARQPSRERPLPAGERESRPRPKRPRSPIDLSLQAGPGEGAEDAGATTFGAELGEIPQEAMAAVSLRVLEKAGGRGRESTRRKWRQSLATAGAAACIAGVFLLSRDWTEKGGSAGSLPRMASGETIDAIPLSAAVEDQERMAAEKVAPVGEDRADIASVIDRSHQNSPMSVKKLGAVPSIRMPAPVKAASPSREILIADLRTGLATPEGRNSLKAITLQGLQVLFR